ncbi:MAG: hypothetical protein RJB18_583 [Pseudomonadota bacterium]|jgi:hypothetical protein
MYEMFNGTIPMHAIAMCILMNVALVLSIAALVKYLIKGKCGCRCNCGCSCCNGKKESCGIDKNSCGK